MRGSNRQLASTRNVGKRVLFILPDSDEHIISENTIAESALAGPRPHPADFDDREATEDNIQQALFLQREARTKRTLVIKVSEPEKFRSRLAPEELCINVKEKRLDVSPNFFWKVYNEHDEPSWHCWVCVCATSTPHRSTLPPSNPPTSLLQHNGTDGLLSTATSTSTGSSDHQGSSSLSSTSLTTTNESDATTGVSSSIPTPGGITRLTLRLSAPSSLSSSSSSSSLNSSYAVTISPRLSPSHGYRGRDRDRDSASTSTTTTTVSSSYASAGASGGRSPGFRSQSIATPTTTTTTTTSTTTSASAFPSSLRLPSASQATTTTSSSSSSSSLSSSSPSLAPFKATTSSLLPSSVSSMSPSLHPSSLSSLSSSAAGAAVGAIGAVFPSTFHRRRSDRLTSSSSSGKAPTSDDEADTTLERKYSSSSSSSSSVAAAAAFPLPSTSPFVSQQHNQSSTHFLMQQQQQQQQQFYSPKLASTSIANTSPSLSYPVVDGNVPDPKRQRRFTPAERAALSSTSSSSSSSTTSSSSPLSLKDALYASDANISGSSGSSGSGNAIVGVSSVPSPSGSSVGSLASLTSSGTAGSSSSSSSGDNHNQSSSSSSGNRSSSTATTIANTKSADLSKKIVLARSPLIASSGSTDTSISPPFPLSSSSWSDEGTIDSRDYELQPTDHVCGCVILQQFVHDSNYFEWGPPLNVTGPPDPRTGAFEDVAEISVFCAKSCGTRLLEAVVEFAAKHTPYKYLVAASTHGAEKWYLSRGFKPVTTLRLPMTMAKKGLTKVQRAQQPHLYRHRIPDSMIDLTRDEPSIMLYLPVPRPPVEPADKGSNSTCSLM